MTSTVSKQQQAYEVLRERILDGTYGPGYRLVIDSLARELDVSQLPVREAIRRLEAEGWITYVRNQGAQVAPIDAASWIDTMRTFAVLEGYGTALAASHLTGADIERLRALNLEMSRTIEMLDVLRFSQHNRAFHETVYARCPNAYLRQELRRIQERVETLRSTIFVYIPTRGRQSIREHEALVDLLETGADALEIELAARAHKLQTVTAYEERLATG